MLWIPPVCFMCVRYILGMWLEPEDSGLHTWGTCSGRWATGLHWPDFKPQAYTGMLMGPHMKEAPAANHHLLAVTVNFQLKHVYIENTRTETHTKSCGVEQFNVGCWPLSLQKPQLDIHNSNEDSIRAAGNQKETMVRKCVMRQISKSWREVDSFRRPVGAAEYQQDATKVNSELYQYKTKQGNTLYTQSFCINTWILCWTSNSQRSKLWFPSPGSMEVGEVRPETSSLLKHTLFIFNN